MAMYMSIKPPIISIIVGPEGNQETFIAHQALLEARSDVFKNVFKRGRFIEGHERVIRFPHQDPEVFNLCLSFAYDLLEVKDDTRRIIDGDAPTDWNAFHEWYDPQATELAQVFVLANMLLDFDMMKAVYSQMEMLAWTDLKIDGKYQQVTFPVTGIIVLHQGLPDVLVTDLCDPHNLDYDKRGSDRSYEFQAARDHDKMLYASKESKPFEFLHTLIFRFFDQRVSSIECDYVRSKKDAEKEGYEKKIKELGARIVELEAGRRDG